MFKDQKLRILGALNGDQILSGLGEMSVGNALDELSTNSEYFNQQKYRQTFKKNVVPFVDAYLNNINNKKTSFTVD